MKSGLWRVVLLLVMGGAIVYPAVGISTSTSQKAEATTITDYDATFTVAKDGDLRAVEKLTVDFPAGSSKHGIFRFFDTRDPSAPHAYRLPHDISVIQDGAKARTKMQWQKSHRYRVIRIGDPGQTVTGTHTYQISYTVNGALEKGTNGSRTQFFWDLIPPGWAQVIDRASLTVHLPTAAERVRCMIGKVGGCQVEGAKTRTLHITVGHLARNTAVTLKAGLDMATPAGGPTTPWTSRWVPVLGSSILTLVIVLIVALIAAAVAVVGSRRTKEPDPGQPLQYAPPDGIGPAQAEYIRTEGTSREMYVASIMQAAQEGVVTLSGNKDSWTIAETGKGWDGVDEITGKVSVLTAGTSFTTSRTDVEKGRQLKSAMGTLDSAVEHWALDDGYLVASGSKQLRWLVGIGGIGSIALAIWNPIGMSVIALVPGLFAFLGAAMVATGASTTHTEKGRDLWARVRGFHRILSTPSAEARFDFASKKDLYLAYVPYAVAFGCADAWAKKYETEMGTAAPLPGYLGGAYAGSAAYSLGSMMDSFSSTVDSAISSYEASQSSSAGGGGGGGGGGGSW